MPSVLHPAVRIAGVRSHLDQRHESKGALEQTGVRDSKSRLVHGNAFDPEYVEVQLPWSPSALANAPVLPLDLEEPLQQLAGLELASYTHGCVVIVWLHWTADGRRFIELGKGFDGSEAGQFAERSLERGQFVAQIGT